MTGGNPETLTNAAGVVVFEGTTSESGGSQAVMANYPAPFPPLSLNASASGPAPFAPLALGTELLDRGTEPPTFLADGFYLVYACFFVSDAGSGLMTDDAIYQAQVYLDPDQETGDTNMGNVPSVPASAANSNAPSLAIANGAQVSAGAKLLLQVTNLDAKTLAFYSVVTVIKIG